MTSQDHFTEESCDLFGGSNWQVYHHHDKFHGHRHCNTVDVMLSICHVTSRDHMFKELRGFMGRSSPQKVATLSCLATIGLMQVEI